MISLPLTKLLTLKISSIEDVMKARQRARQISGLLGFELSAQTRIATAVSEIARNTHMYANIGKVEYYIAQIPTHGYCLKINVSDSGPGITQLATILADRSAAHFKGKGIRGAKNIMDYFTITSSAETGTHVTMAMSIPLITLPITQQKVAEIANQLVRFNTTSVSDEMQQQNQELLQALELLNKSRYELEERVQQRTAQLSRSNQELQQEIQERIAVEKSLQAVTHQLHLALQAARMGTWNWDPVKNELMLDHYLLSLLGLSQHKNYFSLKELLAIIHVDDQTRVQTLFQSLPPLADIYDIEFRVIWSDNSVHFLASRGEIQLGTDSSKMLLTGVCWDITERRQAEEWLRQHQQELAQVNHLTAMGEMGSMLAHELNQPLTVITTFTQGCIRRIQAKDYEAEKILKMMQVVAQQAERAGQIIHRTKDFVRKDKINHERVIINEIIQTAITLLEYEMRANLINIQCEFSNEILMAAADKIQIEQVLLNLMRNAVEAMQQAKIKAPLLRISTDLMNNTHLVVNVIDNGPGFSAELAVKLTEPYFTTKPQGMGMGLAICRSIVEAHGGSLNINSAPEGGAWFQFTLPVVTEM